MSEQIRNCNTCSRNNVYDCGDCNDPSYEFWKLQTKFTAIVTGSGINIVRITLKENETLMDALARGKIDKESGYIFIGHPELYNDRKRTKFKEINPKIEAKSLQDELNELNIQKTLSFQERMQEKVKAFETKDIEEEKQKVIKIVTEICKKLESVHVYCPSIFRDKVLKVSLFDIIPTPTGMANFVYYIAMYKNCASFEIIDADNKIKGYINSPESFSVENIDLDYVDLALSQNIFKIQGRVELKITQEMEVIKKKESHLCCVERNRQFEAKIEKEIKSWCGSTKRKFRT